MVLPRVAFVTPYSAREPLNWSGIPYFMSRALEEHVVLSYMGPLDSPIAADMEPFWSSQSLCKGLAPVIAKSYARQIEEKLANSSFDLIFSLGTWAIAYLDTTIPIVTCTDAPFPALVGFHPSYRSLSYESVQAGMMLERQALTNARLCVFSSSWAADSAVTHFVGRNKVRTVLFGANLPEDPPRPDPKRHHQYTCRLISIGADWYWKGMDIAVDVVGELAKLGIDARLTTCGCVPPLPVLNQQSLEVHPYLNKLESSDWRVFSSIMSNSDFFILPTRAECYGIVFAEAAAFGLVTLCPNIGGVPSAVADMESGKLLPASATAAQYAEAIEAIWSQPALYDRMQIQARDRYEQQLNWRSATAVIARLCLELLGCT
jgi:glycosyltransferase involved in cell wall biosynthesis